MSLLDQIKRWRNEWWRPKIEEQDYEGVINRCFAETFHDPSGKAVLDYLMETYYGPIRTIGTPLTTVDLAERNGQMKMMADILVRFDMGMHPMHFEPEHSSEDEQPMDARLPYGQG